MEKRQKKIELNYTIPGLNRFLKELPAEGPRFTRHYDQGEDFFLKLPEPLVIPSLQIHHDISRKEPESDYKERIEDLIRRTGELIPGVIKDLSYFFDPAEIHKPSFFQVYRYKESYFLYLLRLDLMMRPGYGEVLTPGTNDKTPEYRTDRLYLERSLIPLDTVEQNNGRMAALFLKQLFSETWVGQQGKGYFASGIWIDREISRFLTALFLPEKKRYYPYFAFTCEHKTVTFLPLALDSRGRKAQLPLFQAALQFITPQTARLESALREQEFDKEMPLYRELKPLLPEAFYEPWDGLNVTIYLNEKEMKEFSLDDIDS